MFKVRDKIYGLQRRVKEESLKDPLHRLDDPRQYDYLGPDCLEAVAERLPASPLRGPDYAAEVVHEVIWSQCFGDGNHRTSVAVIQAVLLADGVPFPATSKDQFLASTSQFIDRSHAYADLNRLPYTPAQRNRFKEKQRALVAEWLSENAPTQVGSLAMIGSHSLRTFSSCSEK